VDQIRQSEKNLSVSQMRCLAVVVVTIVLGTSQLAASDKEIVVEVESARGVAAYLEKIGFYDIDSHPERLQAVPRTRILRVPGSTTKVWRENVSLRKSVFFRLGLSAVLQVNEEILIQRERLVSLSMNNLSATDRAWLSTMMERYDIAKFGSPTTPKRFAELMLRLDALPPSLVMVQGAIESGWLQSRFARKGQAVFGQWTNSESGIKALDSEVRLAAFSNPRESLTAYMLNLNTHPAYTELRKARAKLRHDGKPIDGYKLAGHLGKYAETGETYVKLIRDMIHRDALTRADTAKLAPGPKILFRRIDQN
jgi:Bax protein